ncbi:MAG: hypothetical protein M3Y59_20590 [Myxococcota bacterium]|nr:hypothetical protein [Myxococcota bacterium]
MDGETSYFMVATYLAYLVISIGITVWVARTLQQNGRVFLVDAFLGKETLADSVNHLLVVGFYLVNLFHKLRRRSQLRFDPPPVEPSEFIRAPFAKAVAR